MKKIFEQIKFEIEKQEFKYGVQNHAIDLETELGLECTWIGIIDLIRDDFEICSSDYQRRAELIKMAATVISAIDCIDRNNRAIAPELYVKKFDHETFMPFGKYKGDKLKMIPAQYLLDALENNFVDGLLKDYVAENKALLLQVIDTGYDCINSKLI